MKAFKALVFDLGRTLLYFDGDWPQVFGLAAAELHLALKQAGIQTDRQTFLDTFQQQVEDYYRQREEDYIEHTSLQVLRQTLTALGHQEKIPKKLLRPALARMYAVTQAHWLPEAESLGLLQTLQQDGYHLGIISNAGDDADVQTLVDNASFRPYFDFVLTSASCGIRKPHPRIFELGLANWPEITPAQAAMIGDTLEADILGANQSGLYSIWLTRRVENPEQHPRAAEISPNARIQKLDQLPALLEQLAQK